MIGRLQGTLILKKPPELMVDVNGVGYELQASMSTFYQLPDIGSSVILYTHLVVREDAHLLYGFFAERERILFRSLIKINNVGPKLALTVLSGMQPDAFMRCIMENDAVSLSRLPGIGKKTAERLIVEMKDRLPALQEANFSGGIPIPSLMSSSMQDAISALIALGYKSQEARRVILAIENTGASSEELIRLALQQMIKA